MNLQQRIHILTEAGKYMMSEERPWKEAKARASEQNAWFTPEFIDLAVRNISTEFLDGSKLMKWVSHYEIPTNNQDVKNCGIVMAGNIPLVGFHDFLTVFLSGHRQTIKLSSKDTVLLEHLVKKMTEIDQEMADLVRFSDMLRGCDAYIATGSNNSARYFDYYFKKYPHLIRRHRTSIGILTGNESNGELALLADDVNQYFGLGCRNVTKIYVPEGYDFLPLLEIFRKYGHLIDNHKYKHNYDYNLAVHIINRTYYMTNGSIILTELPSLFSPISQLNYETYQDPAHIVSSLNASEIQCIIGAGHQPFGSSQSPRLGDFADGVDTMNFALAISGSASGTGQDSWKSAS